MLIVLSCLALVSALLRRRDSKAAGLKYSVQDDKDFGGHMSVKPLEEGSYVEKMKENDASSKSRHS